MNENHRLRASQHRHEETAVRRSSRPLSPSRRRARRLALVQAGALAFMGTVHFTHAEKFDPLIPELLPGTARAWTLGSGVAELAVAGLLAVPGTRSLGGWSALVLYAGVWPGNLKMAWDARTGPTAQKAVAWGRVPLQVPLFRQALAVARHGR